MQLPGSDQQNFNFEVYKTTLDKIEKVKLSNAENNKQENNETAESQREGSKTFISFNNFKATLLKFLKVL